MTWYYHEMAFLRAFALPSWVCMSLERPCFGLLSSLCLLVSWAPVSQAQGTPLIINGKDANAGGYPWMTALVIDTVSAASFDGFAQQFCGGTLVAPEWVLTAAHCIFDVSSAFEEEEAIIENPSLIKVAVGAHDLSAVAPADLSVVDAVYMHPQYAPAAIDFDVALLHLAEPLSVTPIALAPASEGTLAAAGGIGRAIGWGRLASSGFPTVLQEVDLTLVASEPTCNAVFDGRRSALPESAPPRITPQMLCAGSGDGRPGVCNGDSGGPLFLRNVNGGPLQLGVTSFGPADCLSTTAFGVFARVSAVRPWIDQCLEDEADCSAFSFGSCWDLDGDFSCGAEEDLDGDGTCGAQDCLLSSERRSRFRVDAIAPGAVCEAGGEQLVLGFDANGDGMLADSEEDARVTVCRPPAVAASDGVADQLRVSPAAEDACPGEGFRIQVLRDTGVDGETDRLVQSELVCLSASGESADSAAPEAVGAGDEADGGPRNGTVRIDRASDAECPGGGVKVSGGTDLDGDGLLGDDEISNSELNCAVVAIQTQSCAASPADGVPLYLLCWLLAWVGRRRTSASALSSSR